MKINLLDLFSGIGGFSRGLTRSGFSIQKHYTSEIDKHAKAIYKHKYPDSIDVGDVRHVRADKLARIDAITFGSPCQDFSLAGKRKGMDGERSSLITQAIRLIDECGPKFFIWENVKGTFSSNSGADFWAIIKAFADIGGYRLEWQLLNTAWFLPQNRERIYLVGTLGNKSGPEIFPIKEDGKRIDQKRKQFFRKIRANKNRANCLTSRMHKIGRTDNYIQVGDYRSDEGFRVRKDGNSPTLAARARTDGSGQPLIQVGAIRGRNPENPKSRESGLKTQQQFEENSKGIANTLTSVQKDTVLKINKIPNWDDWIEKTKDHGGTRKEYEKLVYSLKNKPKPINYHGKATPLEKTQIRRLTEIECERLQGFDDNHTKFGNYDGEVKEVSASQRYKCLGNAVTVDVVKEVGKRIKQAMTGVPITEDWELVE